jgi:hypothetical protein
MIYQLHLKKPTKEKNRILNFQRQKNVILVREMAQNLVILQIDVLIVGVMEK